MLNTQLIMCIITHLHKFNLKGETRMTKFKSNGGFTLIELLVVIAVLGILAAVAIPRLTGVTDRARMSEYVSAGGTIRSAMEMYYAEEGEYPDADTYSNLDTALDYVELPDLEDMGTFSYSINNGDNDYTIEITNDGVSGDENTVKITRDDTETITSP